MDILPTNPWGVKVGYMVPLFYPVWEILIKGQLHSDFVLAPQWSYRDWRNSISGEKKLHGEMYQGSYKKKNSAFLVLEKMEKRKKAI